MKLFWIVPECPFPANTGGRVGIWKRIEYMSKNNDIYLFSIIDSEDEKQYKENIEKCCKKVFFYERNTGIQTLIKSVLNPYPAVSRWNERMKVDLKSRYNEIGPDFVIVDLPQMIGVLPENILEDKKVVLNQHNIEFLSMKSLANSIDYPVKRLIYKMVAVQMQHYEQKIYNSNKVRLYTFVSSSDKSFFENEYNLSNTLLVPVGAEVKSGGDVKLNEDHNIIFVGKLSYPPNEAGILWFVDKVFPRVKKKIPDAKLYIVGKEPTDSVKKIQSNDIVVTGEVDSLKPYYERCNVAVVPVMTGGGVNVKLLEALGYGKIVVTTKKGVEGTQFIDGEHLLVGDSAEHFSEQCIEALTCSNRIRRIQIKALEYMNQHYSWQSVVNRLENKLRNINV